MREEIYEYLNKLSENEDVDMYSAPQRVAKQFYINRTLAGAIVSLWVENKREKNK